MRRGLLAALTLLLLAVASGCGEEEREPTRPSGGVDRTFLAEVIPQIQLSEIISRTAARRARGRVRDFAETAAEQRARDLALAVEVKNRLGDGADNSAPLRMPRERLAAGVDPERLVTAKPIGPAYADALARLNTVAIELAQEQLDRGRLEEVKALAGRIVETRSREHAALQRLAGGS